MSVQIDARGLSCPMPVVKTRQSLEKNKPVSATVLVDTAVARDNVTRAAQSLGYRVEVTTSDGEYALKLTK